MTNVKQLVGTKLFSRAILYSLGFAIQRGGAVLFVPIIASRTTDDEFTKFGLFVSLLALLPPLLTLRIYAAPARLWFDHEDDKSRASLIFSSLISSVFMFAGLSSLILVLLNTLIHIPVYKNDTLTWSIAIIASLFRVFSEQNTIIHRVKGEAGKFFSLVVVEGVFLTLGLIYFTFYIQNYFGILSAYAISPLTAGILGLWFNKIYYKNCKFNYEYVQHCVRYSYPTSINLVFSWMISQIGRWVGVQYIALAELAPYTFLAMMVVSFNMIGKAIFESLRPEMSKPFSQGRFHVGVKVADKALMLNVAVITIIWAVFAAIISFFGTRFDLPVLSLEMMLIGFVCGLADAFATRNLNILLGVKKSIFQLKCGVFSGTVTVVLTLCLVGFGVRGLLYSSLTGYLLLALCTRYYYRVIDISYRNSNI